MKQLRYNVVVAEKGLIIKREVKGLNLLEELGVIETIRQDVIKKFNKLKKKE